MLRFMALALLALGLASPSSAADKIPIVATFSILGDIVANVGGDRVSVTTLVGPEADVHVYQPTPKDAASVAKAKAVFENGLGFEGWIKRLKSSAGYKGPEIIASDGVTTIKQISEDDTHHDHDKHAAHGAFEGIDPHAFQSPANGQIYVRNVRDGLCRIDADGCAVYTKNADAYASELQALEADIRARVAALPPERRKIVTSHDAFGYFGKAFGIAFMAPVGISTESEASAKDVAKLIDQIKANNIKALFVENITDVRLLAQIAKETSAKLGGALYSDALSKPGTPGATYLGMFRHNAAMMIPAMAGS